jgi:hypothetical protein
VAADPQLEACELRAFLRQAAAQGSACRSASNIDLLAPKISSQKLEAFLKQEDLCAPCLSTVSTSVGREGSNVTLDDPAFSLGMFSVDEVSPLLVKNVNPEELRKALSTASTSMGKSSWDDRSLDMLTVDEAAPLR